MTAFVPLVFAHQPDGSFGFLPSRSDKLTFTLVSDWFTPPDAPLADAPAYCPDADVKKCFYAWSNLSSWFHH